MEQALERQEALKSFPDEQKRMLNELAQKLKKCLSTVIDEEIPQEYIDEQVEKEQLKTAQMYYKNV